MKIRFTEEEYKRIKESALEFLKDSEKKGLNANRYSGWKPIEYQIENQLVGCSGEFAVARALGIKNFKPKVGVYHRVPDIEPDIEVRSSIDKSFKKLILRDNDDLSRKYVYTRVNLDVTNTVEVEIMGWIVGKDAVEVTELSFGNTKFSKTNNPFNQKPAYFVDNKNLHPFEKLIESYNEKK